MMLALHENAVIMKQNEKPNLRRSETPLYPL